MQEVWLSPYQQLSMPEWLVEAAWQAWAAIFSVICSEPMAIQREEIKGPMVDGLMRPDLPDRVFPVSPNMTSWVFYNQRQVLHRIVPASVITTITKFHQQEVQQE